VREEKEFHGRQNEKSEVSKGWKNESGFLAACKPFDDHQFGPPTIGTTPRGPFEQAAHFEAPAGVVPAKQAKA